MLDSNAMRHMTLYQAQCHMVHAHTIVYQKYNLPYKQVGAPTVPWAVIKCQFYIGHYVSFIYIISCHFMSFHVI
jgi:hypothetical protein